MELLIQLPEFDTLDTEVAKNFDMVSDALFTHLNKRIDVINVLGDDLFTWTKEKLKNKRSWTIHRSGNIDGYPTINKKTLITKFADKDQRNFYKSLWVEKSKKSNVGFRIEISDFFNWYAGQWWGYGKNESDVLFQLRDYERLKSSLEKLENNFEVDIQYPRSDYENSSYEEDRAIGLTTTTTDSLSRETILHCHDIFKTKVLVPLFQLL